MVAIQAVVRGWDIQSAKPTPHNTLVPHFFLFLLLLLLLLLPLPQQ